MSGQSLGFVVAGLGVGAISGLLGIGGAVVLVPMLVFIFGFSQQAAQGTSIGALVPPIGIFAAMAYYRNGFLDVRAAAFIGLGFVFGALGGATLVPYVPQVWLKRIFATVLAYSAAQLILREPRGKMGAVLPGVVGVAALWTAYGVKRALGKKPNPPQKPNRPPGEEYYI